MVITSKIPVVKQTEDAGKGYLNKPRSNVKMAKGLLRMPSTERAKQIVLFLTISVSINSYFVHMLPEEILAATLHFFWAGPLYPAFISHNALDLRIGD